MKLNGTYIKKGSKYWLLQCAILCICLATSHCFHKSVQCSLDKRLPEFEYLPFCAQFLHAISHGSLGFSQHRLSELATMSTKNQPHHLKEHDKQCTNSGNFLLKLHWCMKGRLLYALPICIWFARQISFQHNILLSRAILISRLLYYWLKELLEAKL